VVPAAPQHGGAAKRPGRTAVTPVTVVVARAVATGRDDEFYRWANRLTDPGERFPGFLGSGLLRPPPGSDVWNVVYRFDTSEHLAQWEESERRARLLAQGAAFMRPVAVRRLDGMDAWFAPVGRPASPRWKTFGMTAVVILAMQSAVSARCCARSTRTGRPCCGRPSSSFPW
jgi:uncharacterized protein